MFSNKTNVNLLTALLIAHGVRHAVVCPGSRNAPIVHNLNASGAIQCFPVTDERSAGFQALGLCQATGLPVVVCVTSGTALLNLAPAVAEAYYQHQPLVVVSADRPAQWIDQLDGQTLPQPDALGRFVRKAVTLPESDGDEQQWYCNRLVNEALITARRDGGGPVHINVPITPPLYDFSVAALPEERKIDFYSSITAPVGNGVLPCAQQLLKALSAARRPIIVIGQMNSAEMPAPVVRALEEKDYVVLYEPLGMPGISLVEEMMSLIDDGDEWQPDFILYVGGTLVSKRLKEYLRRARQAVCWRVDEEGEVTDTFMNLRGVVQARPADVFAAIGPRKCSEWLNRWLLLIEDASRQRTAFIPDFSAMLAVKRLEERCADDDGVVFHYANSMAVRLGCIYGRHHIYCNRGVNGIEGSLSTAAGFSLATDKTVYCVIGDLSFFYDRNALWNESLRGNLRILLLNNGGGAIFEKFAPSLVSDGDVRNVMARHHTSARGMCADNGVEYHSATDAASLEEGLRRLTAPVASRPILLEVFTDAETDWACYRRYLASVSSAKH